MVAIAEKNGAAAVMDDVSTTTVDELIGGDESDESSKSVEVGEVIDADFTVTPSIEELQAEITRLTGELSSREKLELQIKEESLSVDRAASEVLSCESAVEEAKGELKAAKERYDKRVNALRDLVRDMATGQGRLDFDKPADAVTVVDGESVTVTADAALTAPVSELGKKKLREIVGADVFDNAKSIGEPIGLTDGQVETIEGEGCQTIADLEKKLREYSLFLTDLKGFGPAAQGRLSMSLTAWRKVHPMPAESGESGEQKPVTKPTIYRGDGSVVEGGVEQMADEIAKSFGDGE